MSDSDYIMPTVLTTRWCLLLATPVTWALVWYGVVPLITGSSISFGIVIGLLITLMVLLMVSGIAAKMAMAKMEGDDA